MTWGWIAAMAECSMTFLRGGLAARGGKVGKEMVGEGELDGRVAETG